MSNECCPAPDTIHTQTAAIADRARAIREMANRISFDWFGGNPEKTEDKQAQCLTQALDNINEDLRYTWEVLDCVINRL